MIRFTTIIISLLVFYFLYGLYIAQYGSYVIPRELKRENPAGFYDYRGVSNVQTSLSRGSSDPADVISEAKKAGLDFLILTDPNPTSWDSSLNTYDGNMLVMNEAEYSFLDERLLHFAGVKDSAPRSSSPGEESPDTRLYFTDLLSKNESTDRDNVVVMAQPFNNGPTWTDPFPMGIDGLEILNPKSISQKAWQSSKTNVLWSLLLYPFSPNLAFLRLFQEPQDEIALWDKLLQKKKISGFAGADASAHAIPFASYFMKFPSYEKSFEIASNHVLIENELSGNYQSDRQKILKALKVGQFYFAVDLLGDPKGFVAYLQDKEKIMGMGSRVHFHKNLKLIAKLPIEPTDFYEIIVTKNGERDATINQPDLEYEIKGPGVYRISVRVSAYLPLPDAKKWITWIYTNPFYVK
jgi:hypothetical protein